MDFTQTRAERERAFARFESVESVHSAVMETFRLVATLPDSTDFISASVQMRLGMAPNVTLESAQDHARKILATLESEKSRDYTVVRASALVAICGAFEYLVKVTFVDHAACHPERAASLLTKAKVRLSASEVLGKSRMEKWVSIADRLFEQLAEPHPQTYERVQKFLLDYTFRGVSEDRCQAVQ